jgi:lipoic acid synthetase
VAEAMIATRKLINGLKLNTVCVEARCPNLTECWSRHTATFMILGDRCTRRCRFCAVSTAKPEPPDENEPANLAEAAEHLNLRHVVITSVARDDLPDEGAGHFARCIRAVRERIPEGTVEVLVPDFKAKPELIRLVVDAAPEVYNHNIEVVASQQKRMRPQARYARSLEVLRVVKDLNPNMRTKSGIMVGVGERWHEILETLHDLRAAQCDLLTIGQYLKPSQSDSHVDVERYYTPEEFERLAEEAKQLGFMAVASGPFVRSSYFAETLYQDS